MILHHICLSHTIASSYSETMNNSLILILIQISIKFQLFFSKINSDFIFISIHKKNIIIMCICILKTLKFVQKSRCVISNLSTYFMIFLCDKKIYANWFSFSLWFWSLSFYCWWFFLTHFIGNLGSFLLLF